MGDIRTGFGPFACHEVPNVLNVDINELNINVTVNVFYTTSSSSIDLRRD